MGNGQNLISYVKMLKMHEMYAAEVRYAQYKKSLFKDKKLSTKIKFYLKRKERFQIEAYNPMMGEKLVFKRKGRTQDDAIARFHKRWDGWVIRKIERQGEVVYEEKTW